MKLLLLLPLAATGALAADSLEAALVENDECQASEGEEGCTLSALQLRGAKVAEESACSPEGQWCGDNYAQKDCCGNNHCSRSGSIFKCQAGSTGGGGYNGGCAPSGQFCGSHSAEKSCCGSGDECQQSGSIWKCGKPEYSRRRVSDPRRRARPPSGPRRRQSNQCKQLGQTCGGLGQMTSRCCDNDARCEKPYGGGDGTMKCVKAPYDPRRRSVYDPRRRSRPTSRPPAERRRRRQAPVECKQVGQVCGGLGQTPQSCCGNSKCQKLFGSSSGTMKCVKEDYNQCKQPNEKCGGPGMQTLSCCRGKCQALWYNPYGSKTCKS